MKTIAIIPARYASTRLPSKPLLDIGGKTMIQRVYERVALCKKIDKVVVATDNDLIFRHLQALQYNVVMTAQNHQSGTDRIWEAVLQESDDYNYIINVQGDEPFINPEQIEELITALKNNTDIATLVQLIKDEETLFNPNAVKCVFNKNYEALYFSRQTIPFIRGQEKSNWLINNNFYKHLGIYGYTKAALGAITQLPPSTLEQAESLEQLRWLQAGYKIKVGITTYDSLGIDTAEDLEKARILVGDIRL